MELGIELDCRKCSEEDKIERGCNHDSPIQDYWVFGKEKYQRCPIRVINNKSLIYLKAFFFFEYQRLPNRGGWLDQPMKYTQIMMFIQSEKNQFRKEIAEKDNHA